MDTFQEDGNVSQSIDTGIAACGEAMCIPRWPEKTPEKVAVTLKTWEEDGSRLIVLDNVEDPSAVRDLMPRLFKARLLLTSKSTTWPAHIGLKTLKLDVFTRPQSIELLHKIASRLRDVPEPELDAIAQKLGDLPLAVDLAGCYLRECFDVSPVSYLKELDNSAVLIEHESLHNWAEAEDNPTNLTSRHRARRGRTTETTIYHGWAFLG